MGPRGFAPTAVVVLGALASGANALYINGSVIAPCDSPLYCQGDVLKAIELARPFSDSKTFVDMPTIKPVDEVIAAFGKLEQPLSNNSELNAFLAANFAPAGGELEEVPNSELETNATFLEKVDDVVIREFTEAVIEIWPELTRRYAGASNNCTECANSFIPVNRTFVVAGGRFREPYYWDSYWIVEGLLRTGGAFTQISKNIIENFLDFVDTIGFVPNGARLYYLNRSQPPLLTEMVRIYVEYTNDTSLLERAVPLLIKEHEFWETNRSVSVKAPDGKTYTLNRYSVNNNQPRPESYREDYNTANNQSYYSTSGKVYAENTPLNDTEKAALYANLATGAESGWDYTTRWISRPRDALEDVYFPLRYLNVRDMVPVDLNSILYQNEVSIASFLRTQGNETGAKAWDDIAKKRSDAMYAVLWNSTLWSYFDYNITSQSHFRFVPLDEDATAAERALAPNDQQVLFNVAQLYPFWTGAAPDQLKNNPLAVQRAFSRVDTMLKEKAGGIPATNFMTGQQWDEPNVWPCLQHVLMEGLRKTPATFGEDDPAYVAVQDLSLRLAQRYLDSTFCTWYATGGSTSATPKLQGLGEAAAGIMFEKYGDNATNVAGSGGEYEVVEGFGWTNGVLIWAVDTFGNKLKRPDCGNITAAHVEKRGVTRRAVELDRWDATWVKKFGKRAMK
ncbi:Six-hairpin glycosidase-like protein [Cercophora newfieldiana]|uniref:Trehalase n=1 Tax=Cercophora newfieldiana TaxID=92897 RepID=A0AA40D0U0_9PEZI|nr:Six-hairpin glycosidase-like protein [Cercophora newfieldiana]